MLKHKNIILTILGQGFFLYFVFLLSAVVSNYRGTVSVDHMTRPVFLSYFQLSEKNESGIQTTSDKEGVYFDSDNDIGFNLIGFIPSTIGRHLDLISFNILRSIAPQSILVERVSLSKNSLNRYFRKNSFAFYFSPLERLNSEEAFFSLTQKGSLLKLERVNYSAVFINQSSMCPILRVFSCVTTAFDFNNFHYFIKDDFRSLHLVFLPNGFTLFQCNVHTNSCRNFDLIAKEDQVSANDLNQFLKQISATPEYQFYSKKIEENLLIDSNTSLEYFQTMNLQPLDAVIKTASNLILNRSTWIYGSRLMIRLCEKLKETREYDRSYLELLNQYLSDLPDTSAIGILDLYWCSKDFPQEQVKKIIHYHMLKKLLRSSTMDMLTREAVSVEKIKQAQANQHFQPYIVSNAMALSLLSRMLANGEEIATLLLIEKFRSELLDLVARDESLLFSFSISSFIDSYRNDKNELEHLRLELRKILNDNISFK